MNTESKKTRFKYSAECKQIFLDTIATIIAIIITFGTEAWHNDKESEQVRRLLAMTIISDIDQSIEVIRKRLEAEEKGHGIASYVMENKDRLESIGEDTLYMFFKYITSSTSFDTDMEFKTMNENIFNSSQDSWRTLNDRKFLNNVQEFYNARAVFEKQREDFFCFRKPFTKAEEYDMLMGDRFENIQDMCRWALESKRVKNYLDYVSLRMNAYWEFMKYVNLNEENKFLMNITEQDMEDFANQTYMEIYPAKEKDLIGTWTAVLPDDKNEITYEFKRDHTFIRYQSIRWGHHLFSDKMVQRFKLSGTWAVEDDSLVKYFDTKSYKIEIDDKNISYPPHLADRIREVKAELASEAMKPATVKEIEKNSRVTHATNVDKSGTRLELTDGNKNTVHYQKKVNN